MFGDSDGTEGGPKKANCATWMRSHCAPEMQKRSMLMAANPAGNTSLAAFLVARPPYGYIGCAPSLLSRFTRKCALLYMQQPCML